MMKPKPSPAFKRFFAKLAKARQRAAAVEQQQQAQRMDPSFPSQSGARFLLTTLGE